MMTFREVLDEMARDYHLVVVDDPPLLGFPESLRMSRMADGVLMVAEADSTDGRALASCIASPRKMKAEVIGLVLNGMSRTHGSRYFTTAPFTGSMGAGEGYPVPHKRERSLLV
jgi:Mrp family chromosome partitioning ATPase